MEVADDELTTRKLADRSDIDTADTVSRDSATDTADRSHAVNIPSSLSHRRSNLMLGGEYSSSVDSDTGRISIRGILLSMLCVTVF